MSEPPRSEAPPDFLALLQAAEEQGDDTALQLLADWLEDNDEPLRAELIHLRLELAALPEDADRAVLLERQRTVQAALEQAWLAPLGGGEWRFERGLVDSVALDVRCFLDHAEDIC